MIDWKTLFFFRTQASEDIRISKTFKLKIKDKN